MNPSWKFLSGNPQNLNNIENRLIHQKDEAKLMKVYILLVEDEQRKISNFHSGATY